MTGKYYLLFRKKNALFKMQIGSFCHQQNSYNLILCEIVSILLIYDWKYNNSHKNFDHTSQIR